MRKLQPPDLFNAMRIIRKAGIKEELKPVIRLAASGEFSIQDVGIEGILTIIETLAEKKSEQAIYEFISGPFEMTVKEIESMDLIQLAENLETLAKENDLKLFFTLLAGFLKS